LRGASSKRASFGADTGCVDDRPDRDDLAELRELLYRLLLGDFSEQLRLVTTALFQGQLAVHRARSKRQKVGAQIRHRPAQFRRLPRVVPIGRVPQREEDDRHGLNDGKLKAATNPRGFAAHDAVDGSEAWTSCSCCVTFSVPP